MTAVTIWNLAAGVVLLAMVGACVWISLRFPDASMLLLVPGVMTFFSCAVGCLARAFRSYFENA